MSLTHVIVSLSINESLSKISLTVKRILSCGDGSQREGSSKESCSRVLHDGELKLLITTKSSFSIDRRLTEALDGKNKQSDDQNLTNSTTEIPQPGIYKKMSGALQDATRHQPR